MGCSGAIMVLCSLLFYHKWSSDISNVHSNLLNLWLLL